MTNSAPPAVTAPVRSLESASTSTLYESNGSNANRSWTCIPNVTETLSLVTMFPPQMSGAVATSPMRSSYTRIVAALPDRSRGAAATRPRSAAALRPHEREGALLPRSARATETAVPAIRTPASSDGRMWLRLIGSVEQASTGRRSTNAQTRIRSVDAVGSTSESGDRTGTVRTYVLDRPAARVRPLPPGDRAPGAVARRGRGPGAPQ